MMLTGLYNVILPVLTIVPSEIARTFRDPENIVFVIFAVAVAVLGLIGAAGYVSELFGIPGRRSKRLQRELLAAQAR